MVRGIAIAVALSAAAASGQTTMTCPDSLTTARMIDNGVGSMHAAWKADPRSALPPDCVYEAIARNPLAHSDSAVVQALDLTAEALRRSPENPVVLKARVTLLSRAGRYAAVAPAVDELFFARPSMLSPTEYRLAIAAAMQLHDTVGIVNRLANAATRFPRVELFAREYDVWRQLPRLRAVIDTVRRRIAVEPGLAEGYSILASVYGNLDMPDSALANARGALKRGVSPSVVGPALESLIGVRMRRAQILGATEAWQRTLPVALAIDSVLPTPASKYLVALTLSEIVADGTRLAQEIHFGLETGQPEGYGRLEIRDSGSTVLRVMTCERLAELRGMIALANSKLASGGRRFATETIPALQTELDTMNKILEQLKPKCA
jgi:hypothetical protein